MSDQFICTGCGEPITGTAYKFSHKGIVYCDLCTDELITALEADGWEVDASKEESEG